MGGSFFCERRGVRGMLRAARLMNKPGRHAVRYRVGDWSHPQNATQPRCGLGANEGAATKSCLNAHLTL
eukprot:scaffold311729_cov24-Tisochrysis_lutea.AAC.2